jgi:hypothetical protein
VKVEFYGIRRYGTRNAVVHTSVDGLPVIWDERGWRCGHGCDDLNRCLHIDAVEALLAPSVLGDW